MPHIHTEPGQHDFTVSAYIVRTDLPEPAILLHLHRKLNKWMQFGGHVELHENPWQAIGHELTEESGYDMTQLNLLQPKITRIEFDNIISHPWPAVVFTGRFGDLDHFHTDLTYVFTTNQEPKHMVGDHESQKMRWFTRGELLALEGEQVLPDVQKICLTILDDYLKNWDQVSPPYLSASASKSPL